MLRYIDAPGLKVGSTGEIFDAVAPDLVTILS
jgi:hypothetical protein